MISTSLSNFAPVIVSHYIGYGTGRKNSSPDTKGRFAPAGRGRVLLSSRVKWSIFQSDWSPGIQKRVTARQIGTAGSLDGAISRLAQEMELGQCEIVLFEFTADNLIVVA